MNDLITHLSGELNFVTVPALSKSNLALIAKEPRVVFDLSQVTISDNTGVALLVVLASHAKKIQKEIAFTKLPKQLLDLVEAARVKELLPIL